MAETLAAVVQEVEENEDFRVQVNSSCIVSEWWIWVNNFLFQLLETVSVFLSGNSDSEVWEMLVVSVKVGFGCLDFWLQGGAVMLVVMAVLGMLLYLLKVLRRGGVNVSVGFLWVFADFDHFRVGIGARLQLLMPQGWVYWSLNSALDVEVDFVNYFKR